MALNPKKDNRGAVMPGSAPEESPWSPNTGGSEEGELLKTQKKQINKINWWCEETTCSNFIYRLKNAAALDQRGVKSNLQNVDLTCDAYFGTFSSKNLHITTKCVTFVC